MNLIIDVGNTRTKISVFSKSEMQDHITISAIDTNYIQNLTHKYAIKNCIVSSVSTSADTIFALLPQSIKPIFLNKDTPLPIRNHYKSPHSLGSDRIAAACGAFHLYPNENILVIDAGTALTYEFINNQGEYLGGAITPGITMRFKALHKFTSKLPLVDSNIATAPLIGNTTESCIQSGVLNGIFAEADGIIDRYKQYYTNLQVILTGGDTKHFDKNLKNSIFAAPFLVEIGLNRILHYNAK